MTQDEIIELGKQAGLCDREGRDDNSIIITDHLERFAKLVAEKALKDHAMREAQRIGQEIEQKPVRLQCVTCGTVYADGVPPQVTQPEQEPVAYKSSIGHMFGDKR